MPTLKEAALKRGETYHIDPRILKTKPDFNPRDMLAGENAAHVNELMISIKAVGVKVPLTVYHEDGEIYVQDGHCRLAACQLAIATGCELVSVPCLAADRNANDTDKA